MSIFPSATVASVILAGGQSSRMGQDKALIPWNGVPLLQRVSEVATQCTEQVYIVTPWPDRYRAIAPPHCQWIVESNPGNGPLVALSQVWERIQHPWILLLGCDLPNLDPTLLQHWIAQLSDIPESTLAVVPIQGKYWEPLCGFYRPDHQLTLKSFIQNGGSAFQHWLSSIPVQPLPVDARIAQILHNCNTPADLKLSN
ncbi:molybdenum cofactor guanylyltransferase [Roseofilum reptotaenium CS-1145]|uniref:Probable molybdenum cofactor guanylyltransferase n=1 Tax=Roseofilum reptotaenium AO1-A TaxID=1925591 RepID=A0A1L9QLI9_9CYAN|nr:molybdenum cofactor guanylyltransferase [Roseofilum reptotaenium]MDB9516826.1 molybdenum cofactor guanylyltransferase [Roseofilum reptotaenium CS-1145]OJJ18989.1 molybdenum cofactor guanylyltransferase [Roseofilum reptotaenium AO1-A]